MPIYIYTYIILYIPIYTDIYTYIYLPITPDLQHAAVKQWQILSEGPEMRSRDGSSDYILQK
jgi:hypothetical protein